ncbi:hypothetical protein RB597_005182 [Gaeumannomyces tritici]
MYIPVGTVPSSLDQLVGDLERRQARGGAASVKSVSTNNSGANSVQSNNTNSTRGRGRAPAPAVPAPRVPVGQQPRSIDDLMSDLETRQIRGGAASVSSASSNGAQSVQSNNTNSTRGGGRAQPAPAPRVPIGQQPRSIDELVADLETRQIRGDAASVASASTGGAQSVQSANTNSTGGVRRPAPPARIPVGSRPRSIDELLSDLERRQVRGGGAASVSSVSTNGRSVQSANTNSTRGARQPVPPPAQPVLPPALPVPPPALPAPPPALPASPPALPTPPPARIPIGAQPRSLAELVGDLERRQVAGGDAASVSSVSTKKSNKAKSVKTTEQSSGAAPAPTPTSSALPQPPAAETTSSAPAIATTSSALPQPPTAEPTSSAPAIATTPAVNPAPPASSSSPTASSANPVQNPAVPLSSTAIPVEASPSPTTLLTRVSSSPGGGDDGRTALPDLGLSSSSTASTGPVVTVLPPASELPSVPPPPGGSANSEMGLQGGGGGAPMGTSAMVGVIFGSVLSLAVVAAFLFVCCVRRRRAKSERESRLAMAAPAPAAQYPDEKGAAPAAVGKRPVSDWEDRLYGSADRTSGAGFSDRAKSIFVVPWKFISGNRGSQQPPPPPPPPPPPSEFPQLPQPPKLGGEAGPASTRYSKRSTGLTTLDETQFTTYNNLVGRSNPKKPVAFDNPYFQKDEWK